MKISIFVLSIIFPFVIKGQGKDGGISDFRLNYYNLKGIPSLNFKMEGTSSSDLTSPELLFYSKVEYNLRKNTSYGYKTEGGVNAMVCIFPYKQQGSFKQFLGLYINQEKTYFGVPVGFIYNSKRINLMMYGIVDISSSKNQDSYFFWLQYSLSKRLKIALRKDVISGLEIEYSISRRLRFTSIIGRNQYSFGLAFLDR